MKKLFSIIFIFVLSFVVFGQTKKPVQKATPAPTPKIPIIEIDATTKDGKAVILRSDGTWQFNENAAALTPQPEKQASLEIEGAIIFKNGDIVPIARSPIALLNESAVTLIKNAGIKEYNGKTSDFDILTAFVFANIRGNAVVNDIANSIKAHVIYNTETDFNGKASFTKLTPGKYYLFAATEARKSQAIWNLLIEIKAGERLKVVLDQNNAALAF